MVIGSALEKDLRRRIEQATREDVSIVSYDPRWPGMFDTEARFLRRVLPPPIIRRIEHFGSTAVPAMEAKPIIDILIEVSSLAETQKHVVPILTSSKYEYFWRTDTQPSYAWFIKRDPIGQRSHHLHFVESDSPLWDRLFFRDYLRQFPDVARRYGEFPNDRVAYTEGKTDFILEQTRIAKQYFAAQRPAASPDP
jgi:GrpB-like predicted nucleotidyltransferase (UPF0157 family)